MFDCFQLVVIFDRVETALIQITTSQSISNIHGISGIHLSLVKCYAVINIKVGFEGNLRMNRLENHSRLQSTNLITKLLIIFITLCAFAVNKQTFAQSTCAGKSQHTAVFKPPATNLNVLKWQSDIDLNVTGLSHYGSPVVSANNTVIVPVKISATGFRVD